MQPLIIEDRNETKTYAWVNFFVDINAETSERVPMSYWRNIEDPLDEIVFNHRASQFRSINIKEDMARRNRRPDNGNNS